MSTATLEKPKAPAPDPIVRDDELYEVIDGERVRTPPMGVFAVWTAFELARHLGNFAAAQLGRAVTEALFRLPAPINRGRRPDVAFVSYNRWAKSRPMPRTDNAWDVVPNLVTEVVSPTDAAEDLEAKVAEYFRAGVELVWVVYPLQSRIHVYNSPTHIDILTRTDELDGGAIVPGFRLALAELFTQSDEPTPAPDSSTEPVQG